MPLEVKRKNRETSQGLVRRFGKRLKKSGILRKARKNRFKARKKSNLAKKKEALRREELKKEYVKMEKLGKLPERRRRR